MSENGKLSKRDRGAMLFQSLFNSVSAICEDLTERSGELREQVWELRRRVDVLENRARYYSSSLVRRGAAAYVELACIACGEKVQIPEAEAQALECVAICPKCKNYAVLSRSRLAGEELTAKDVAQRTGLHPDTVSQIARAQGIGRKVGHYRYFREDDVPRFKRRRKKNVAKTAS